MKNITTKATETTYNLCLQDNNSFLASPDPKVVSVCGGLEHIILGMPSYNSAHTFITLFAIFHYRKSGDHLINDERNVEVETVYTRTYYYYQHAFITKGRWILLP